MAGKRFVREGRVRRAIDAFNGGFTKVHSWAYISSRGWVGHRWTIVPSLILWTRGRRSVLLRGVVLVYVRDGDSILVVGSNFGKDKPPGWLLNLEAQSAASVNVGRRRFNAEAEIVMPGETSYERLLATANAGNRDRYVRYRVRYRALTVRPIPVVILKELRPASPPGQR